MASDPIGDFSTRETGEMIELDPAYDMATGTWFMRGWPHEAPTLAELLRQLPPGDYRIEGYYPLGTPMPRVDHGTVTISKRLPTLQDVVGIVSAPKIPSKKVKAPAVNVPPEIVDKVLDLWRAGVSGVEIARELRLTPQKVSAHIIPKARECGDPRAVVRNPRSFGRKNVSKSADNPPVSPP